MKTYAKTMILAGALSAAFAFPPVLALFGFPASLVLSVFAAAALAAFAAAHLREVRRAARERGLERVLRAAAEPDGSREPADAGSFGAAVRAYGGFFRTLRAALHNAPKDDGAHAGDAIERIGEDAAAAAGCVSAAEAARKDLSAALEALKRAPAESAESAEPGRAGIETAVRELTAAVRSARTISGNIAERTRDADALKESFAEGGERVLSTNDSIRAIAYEIKGIAEVIDLFDQISEQTNILSMNAAIESAHAGAAGKGFAVVAEEIRKLAESTQDNAQRIGSALQSINEKAGLALASGESAARSFETINDNFLSFVQALERIASDAAGAGGDAERLAEAVADSLVSIGGKPDDGPAMLHERVSELQAASAAAERMGSSLGEAGEHLDEMGPGIDSMLKAFERTAAANDSFRTRCSAIETALAALGNDRNESTGVAVKSPPVAVDPKRTGKGTAEATLHRGALSAEARIVE